MLELRDVRLRRGAAVLFDRANLTIFRGDKIGVVGRNGCGKSSLLALLRGELGPDTGDYSVPGKLNFVSVSQELPRTEATVLEYVRSGDRRLMEIEAELEKGNAFIAGDSFTIADIALGLSIHRWFIVPFDHRPLPHVQAYYERLKQREAGARWMPDDMV